MAGGLSICARGLEKSFDGGLVRALAGMDLDVGAGEVVAIMGPTGCGKSTLLALLCLLDEPDAGEIILDGQPSRQIRCPEDWRAEHVGVVFQLHHLLPHLTLAENVTLPLLPSLGRREAARRAEELLSTLGLLHRAGTLAARASGGERQLGAVARALVNSPQLVLADEPTGSVDSRTGQRILDVVVGWSRSSGASLILVTHDRTVAQRADRLVRMLDGRVAGEEPPSG